MAKTTPNTTRSRSAVLKSPIDATPESGVQRTVLPGGLRVVTEFIPGVRSASVGVLSLIHI